MTTELETWRQLAKTTDLGWPKWEAHRGPGMPAWHMLSWSKNRGFFVGWGTPDNPKRVWLHGVTDHEATCLWRDHAWRWLEILDRPLPRIRPGDDSAEALQTSVWGAHKKGKESQ